MRYLRNRPLKIAADSSPPDGCGVFGEAAIPHDAHTAEVVLTWFGRAILIVFGVELLILFACMRSKFFTLHYVLDALVVGVSIILTFAFDGNTKIEIGTALIIFLRCWRFARVLHGFGNTVHNVSKKQEEKQRQHMHTRVSLEGGRGGE